MTSFTPAPKPERTPSTQRSSILQKSPGGLSLEKPKRYSSIKPPTKEKVLAFRQKQQAKAKARGPIKAKKRKPSEFQRIYGGRVRVRWIKAQRCAVRGGACQGPIENAHAVSGGMGRKADAHTILPLCKLHHLILHNIGAQSFELHYGVRLKSEAAHTHGLWLLHCGRAGLDPETGKAL